MKKTVKAVKESLIRKEKLNLALGVVFLAVTIVFGTVFAKKSIWGILVTIALSLLAIMFFFLSCWNHRKYMILKEEIKPAIYFYGNGKEAFSVKSSSFEEEKDNCDPEICDGNCGSCPKN